MLVEKREKDCLIKQTSAGELWSLIWFDQRTLFGLKPTEESKVLLMSLPPHVQWVYDHHPEVEVKKKS
jgi:coproporphyrinogen III oxidase